MSSTKSRSSLRILWIPGRKKHNRKGIYNPTKQTRPQYQANQQKKNEPWSLGGGVNHSKIINADLHENIDVGMATAAGAMSLTAMAANKTNEASSSSTSNSNSAESTANNAAASSSLSENSNQIVELVVLNDLNGDINKKNIPTSNQFDALEHIDECEEKDTNYSNAESASSLLSSNNDSRSVDYAHNSATLAIGETRRRRRRNSYNNSRKDSCENFDSIDHINETDAVDAVDAVKIMSSDDDRLDTFRQEKKNKKKNDLNSKKKDDGGEPNEKLVTCLYYSLVCWDCTIS
ncbi:uncharacterized protein DDB_G0271670 isoform X2 [Toxorhynchites rutilus septentrionalis]|uniref:uncharacterized protein DDB_G0271670 isoform X2 n=1 Tax=Toxorhynchites rutilus septentrionalis TaxID=329112 RepID=UPI00247AA125|nr:uncharacterized protein DDB_G0271670 isoform X2 [Toxorhynchites rutilus septentrionalis]